ncbi:MAG: glycosyltransferase family 39 protein, partial [Anaerolineales bacterium]|nr:glycosyltransferase family 39 protein [Anaerolineales bacterium]
WMQYQSFYPWPTPNQRQIIFPMNGELGLLWTILWGGSDQFAGFVQWLAVPAIMLGIYGFARLLEYPRTQAALSALLWATVVQVRFQSHTTQNDLITASFWVALVYFFFQGLREESRAAFYFSGIAFGLAIGSKSTSLVMLPGFALAVFLVALKNFRNERFRAQVIRWVLSASLGFLLLGSYIYIQNFVAFGYPLGPRAFSTNVIGIEGEETIGTHLALLRDNLGRYIYQLVDFSTLPPGIVSVIQPIKKGFFSLIYNSLGITVENQETIGIGRGKFNLDYINIFNADNSWFGPLLVFLIPAILAQTYQGARRRDMLRLTLGIIPIAFLLLFSAAQDWTPAKGRYFAAPVALAFPLIASIFEVRIFGRRLAGPILVLLGIMTLFFSSASGIYYSRDSDWKKVLLFRRDEPAWLNDFDYQMLTQIIPENASIGLRGAGDFRDYPFF